jgi:superfamily I DNA/RNA helicase
MIDLDREQRQAVDAGPSDLFISAGAGSGKTRVLTARFVSAVLGLPPYEPCDPGGIVAVTYTEKAAGELAERIRRALSAEEHHAEARQIGDAWISTIHGMCARILHQYAFDAGLDPQFTVLDEVESSALEVATLEEAVLDLVGDDAGLVELIDAYGFEAVATAVRRVRSDVRGLGLGPCEIRTLDPDEVRGALAAVAEGLAGLAEDFAGMRQTKTVENNACSARSAAALLAEALASAEIDTARTLESLQPMRFRRLSTIEGHDECVAAARELTDRARAALAQIAVAPLEGAFLRPPSATAAHWTSRTFRSRRPVCSGRVRTSRERSANASSC